MPCSPDRKGEGNSSRRASSPIHDRGRHLHIGRQGLRERRRKGSPGKKRGAIPDERSSSGPPKETLRPGTPFRQTRRPLSSEESSKEREAGLLTSPGYWLDAAFSLPSDVERSNGSGVIPFAAVAGVTVAVTARDSHPLPYSPATAVSRAPLICEMTRSSRWTTPNRFAAYPETSQSSKPS